MEMRIANGAEVIEPRGLPTVHIALCKAFSL